MIIAAYKYVTDFTPPSVDENFKIVRNYTIIITQVELVSEIYNNTNTGNIQGSVDKHRK